MVIAQTDPFAQLCVARTQAVDLTLSESDEGVPVRAGNIRRATSGTTGNKNGNTPPITSKRKVEKTHSDSEEEGVDEHIKPAKKRASLANGTATRKKNSRIDSEDDDYDDDAYKESGLKKVEEDGSEPGDLNAKAEDGDPPIKKSSKKATPKKRPIAKASTSKTKAEADQEGGEKKQPYKWKPKVMAGPSNPGT